MEHIEVDPQEELLKTIGIVHGQKAENDWRFILARLEEARKRALNAVPWTAERIQYVLDTEVKYKDWRFVVQKRNIVGDMGDRLKWDIDLRLRAEWMGADAATGKLEKQQSRWWPLSIHMVKTEVIQTAFLCTLKAEEHEIREAFRYQGKAPFHSHIDIDTLVAISDNVDVRTDPRPEAPANQRRE